MAKRLRIPAKWRKLFDQHLPGYDPIGTCGDQYRFDESKASRSVSFFPAVLTHVEGNLAGKPFHLSPWQQAMVGCAFGFVDRFGWRRYREVFQYVPRKNGKTTMCGGLVNMVALCDNEPGAQLYSAAAEKEQAALVYRQATGMIEASPLLKNETRVYTATKTIQYPYNTFYKALSKDDKTKHGFNTHFVIVDELHCLPDSRLVNTLTSSTGSRDQPLIWYITTADSVRPSVCNDKLDYSKKVRDGVIDDKRFLPVVYETLADEDWKDPEVWVKCNPNVGISVNMEYLERECKKAEVSVTQENWFKRYSLNMKTQQDVRWINMEKWNLSGGAVHEDSLRGKKCFGALDLASTNDITALTLLFKEGGVYQAIYFYWVPELTAQSTDKARTNAPYEDWASKGLMTLTDGDEIDYDTLCDDIDEIANHYGIEKIAVDRLFQGAQLCQNLSGRGMNIVPFGQGFISMAAPAREFERLVNRGEFLHGNNEVTNWMASNVSVEFDSAENMKPSKKKSGDKIDGIVTSVMAVGMYLLEEQQTGSVYEERGLREV